MNPKEIEFPFKKVENLTFSKKAMGDEMDEFVLKAAKTDRKTAAIQRLLKEDLIEKTLKTKLHSSDSCRSDKSV